MRLPLSLMFLPIERVDHFSGFLRQSHFFSRCCPGLVRNSPMGRRQGGKEGRSDPLGAAVWAPQRPFLLGESPCRHRGPLRMPPHPVPRRHPAPRPDSPGRSRGFWDAEIPAPDAGKSDLRSQNQSPAKRDQHRGFSRRHPAEVSAPDQKRRGASSARRHRFPIAPQPWLRVRPGLRSSSSTPPSARARSTGWQGFVQSLSAILEKSSTTVFY